MPFIASPSAHPIGPHRGEESQVVAIGLCQEHRLPRMQGKAGTGVPLLRKQDHRGMKATTVESLPPTDHHPACTLLLGFCPLLLGLGLGGLYGLLLF